MSEGGEYDESWVCGGQVGESRVRGGQVGEGGEASRGSDLVNYVTDQLTKCSARHNTIPTKVCGVCGEAARSTHFGGVSCASCKSFFRRSVQGHLYTTFLCVRDHRCPLLQNRRCCQACRYRRCREIGMDPALVMSEEDRDALRSRRLERKRRQLLQHLTHKHNTDNGGQVDELEGQVDGLEGQVDGLGGQVDGLGGQVDELEGQVDGLGSQVDENVGQLDTHLLKQDEPMDQQDEPMDQHDELVHQDKLWNEHKLTDSDRLFEQDGLADRSQNMVEVKLENPDEYTDKARFEGSDAFKVEKDTFMYQEDILVAYDTHLSSEGHQNEGCDPCLGTLSCEDTEHIIVLRKLLRKALAFPDFPKHYYEEDADVMEHLLFVFCKAMGKFFSIVPDFREMEPKVQGVLLKEGVAKAVFIFGAHQFQEQGECWPRKLLTPSCTFPKVTMFAVQKFLNDRHTFTRIKTFMGKYCFFFTDEIVTVLTLMLAVFDPDDPGVRAGMEVAATRDKYLRLLQSYLTHRDPSVSPEAIISELWLCFAEVQQLTICFKSSNTSGADQAAASKTVGDKETAFASSFHELSGDSMLPPKKAFYKRNTKMTEEGESSDVIFLEEIQSSYTTQYGNDERRFSGYEAIHRRKRGVEWDSIDLGTTTPTGADTSMQDHNYPISSPQIHGHPQNFLNSPGKPETIKLKELEMTPLPLNYKPSQNYRDITPESSINISPSQTILPLPSHRETSAILIPVVRGNNSSQMLTLDPRCTQFRDHLQRPENWHNPSEEISVARNLAIGHNRVQSGHHAASHFVNTQGSSSCRMPPGHLAMSHQTLDTRHHLPSDLPQSHQKTLHRLSLQDIPTPLQEDHLRHLKQKFSSLERHLEQPHCLGHSCCDVRQVVQQEHHPRVDAHRHSHNCCPPSYHSEVQSLPVKHSLAKVLYHDDNPTQSITCCPVRSLSLGDRHSPSLKHSPVGALYHPDRPSPSPTNASGRTHYYPDSPSSNMMIGGPYHTDRSSTYSLVEDMTSRADQQVLQAVEGILPTKLVKHLATRLRIAPRHLPR